MKNIEAKTYPDGTTAIGVAPLPEASPATLPSGIPFNIAVPLNDRTYWSRLCALRRSSFIRGAGPFGGVQRVDDKSGNWIEMAEAQTIVDDAETALIEARQRIADLEARLEAVGAGGVQRLVPGPMDHFKAAHQLIAALLRVEPSFRLHEEQVKGVLLARLEHGGVEYDVEVNKSPPMTDEDRAEVDAIAAAILAADPADFPLGKACDLSGEGNCEACQ